MTNRTNRIPPALKHGVYSGLALLPGEDPIAHEKFCEEILSEYKPVGRSEEDIVMNMASLMWRRENLITYRLADHARKRHSSIYNALRPAFTVPLLSYQEETRTPEELRALRRQADQQAQTELGPALELVEAGDVVTTDHLLSELSIAERLEDMIDRCIKRLLMVRGYKSLSLSAPSSPARISKVA
jgi:hypothetical protein